MYPLAARSQIENCQDHSGAALRSTLRCVKPVSMRSCAAVRDVPPKLRLALFLHRKGARCTPVPGSSFNPPTAKRALARAVGNGSQADHPPSLRLPLPSQ